MRERGQHKKVAVGQKGKNQSSVASETEPAEPPSQKMERGGANPSSSQKSR